MQVYAVLYDPNNNVLIAQKRASNRFWQGKVQHNGKTSVNQAGQFCLPGGGLEPTDGMKLDIAAGARREFKEETGVTIDRCPNRHIQPFKEDGCEYAMALFEYPNIAALAWIINVNLQPRTTDAQAPAGTGITDWELSSVRAVPVRDVGLYLGRQQGKALHGHRHAINWYATMAASLPSLLTHR